MLQALQTRLSSSRARWCFASILVIRKWHAPETILCDGRRCRTRSCFVRCALRESKRGLWAAPHPPQRENAEAPDKREHCIVISTLCLPSARMLRCPSMSGIVVLLATRCKLSPEPEGRRLLSEIDDSSRYDKPAGGQRTPKHQTESGKTDAVLGRVMWR